jgi:hypothetical protein
MVYDEARQQVVLFGGLGGPSGSLAPLSDTWIWDGANWSQMALGVSPPARFYGVMAYDAARQQTVLFGGNPDFFAAPLADTWVWDGSEWTKKTPATSPPARFSSVMAYDAARQQIVLFGGETNNQVLADTWTWDGNTWTPRFTATSPSFRLDAAMAYDAANQNTVLFGGEEGNMNEPADTWIWDGSNWSQRFPPRNPSARFSATMVYDPTLSGTILFGGLNIGGYQSDTWKWDGAAWSPVLTPTSPAPRAWASAAYDALHQQTVLFGGTGGGPALQDAWLLLSLVPTQISLTAFPSPTTNFGQLVQLNSIVSPTPASGFVTFYTGTTILASAPVIAGRAQLNTFAVPAGTNVLHAYFSGDTIAAPSSSPTFTLIVNAFPASTYATASGSPVPVGAGPFALVVADFNSDFKLDLAVVNAADASVTVLLGDAQGGFHPSPGGPFPTGAGPFSLAATDFNGDGKMDLAVANAGSDSVTVLLGDGAGGFSPAPGSPFSAGPSPTALIVADFNGDGRPDIAVGSAYQKLGVYLGTGDGTFALASDFLFTFLGGVPNAFAAADFIGNGKPDLLVAETTTNRVANLEYFYNRGDGTFDREDKFLVGSNPVALAVGDFNGDGYPDVAVADLSNNYVTILVNSAGTGSSRFLPNPATFPVGISPESLAVGDFNGDGKLDLAVANSDSNNIVLLLGDGTGKLAPAPSGPLAVGSAPFFVAAADFNRDSRTDLAVVNYLGASVSILLGMH